MSIPKTNSSSLLRLRARRFCPTIVVAALALAASTGLVSAQAPVLPPPPLEVPRLLPNPEALARIQPDSEVKWLVDRMSSPDYQEREAAMQTLLERRASADELCALLERPGTDEEQRFRILSVLRHMLITIPSGALGITMQPRPEEPGAPAGVEITDLLEGMPAEKVLQRRDRITHIDGRPLVGRSDLVIIVQTKRPGDDVKLQVSRPQRDAEGLFVRDADGRIQYTPLELELRLGSVDDLHDPVTGRPQPNSLIRSTRASEAAEAERRYLPRPKVVKIAAAESFDFIAPRPAPVTDAEVDNHSIIKNLRAELARIKDGGLEITPEKRQAWATQRKSLNVHSKDPSLPTRDAELMRRVMDRFSELTRP